jgi:hypothetical protein
MDLNAKIVYNAVVRREKSLSKDSLLVIGLSVYQIDFSGNNHV